MPVEPIPFMNFQESGSSALAGASPVAVNVVIDQKGAVSRRPGIETYSLGPATLPSAKEVIGLFGTDDGSVYASTADLPGAMEVYKLQSSGAALDLTAAGVSKMTASSRTIWAETEPLVVFATGRGVHKIEVDGLKLRPLDGAPPIASHVIVQASRLLANDVSVDRTKVRYSAVAQGTTTYAGHEQWDAVVTALGRSGFFTAEARPDDVVALAENSNEVWAFGTGTTQIFVPDNALVFASVSTREFGCSASHSVVKDDQSFAWLDHARRFVSSDGRSVNILSQGIQRQLDDLKRVDDCFGYRVVHGYVDCLVWTFPSDGRTFAYQRGAGWSEWMGWNTTSNNWAKFPVTAHTRVLGTNDNVVGTSAGKIGVMRVGVSTDLGDRIPAHVTTGYLDRGTDSLKHCRSVKLALARGAEASGSTAPVGSIQFRDDGGVWSERLDFDLGTAGDTYPVVEFRSLGVYRRREWRFNFQGSGELTLARATEEYEVLGN